MSGKNKQTHILQIEHMACSIDQSSLPQDQLNIGIIIREMGQRHAIGMDMLMTWEATICYSSKRTTPEYHSTYDLFLS